MSEYIEVFKRSEIKYLLNEKQYEELFSFLQTMARVDAYGLSRINNIYFDTPDYRLIRTSLEKPVYKEKIRLRTYGETSNNTNSFIEIKKKYDGVVYKRRISGRYLDTYNYMTGNGSEIDDTQISKEIRSFIDLYDGLRPAMTIWYDRIAMAGINDKTFRVTFDKDIRWDTRCLDLRWAGNKRNILPGNIGRAVMEPGMYMMEIKVTSALPMELARKMSELGIFPVSFSKYGRAYTQMIKENNEVVIKACQQIAAADKDIRKGAVAYV
ncbi:MAG: polyphosphate polymerase domain-containing protein [Eubacterium sp.]|nr:polyphosphate polymerase domain-containing protein [Eubacterium sp.]